MNTLNQTLQEKFPHLELSVLKLSEVKRDNETKRIDSEFFKKEYLENEEKIKGKTIILNFLDTKIQNIKNFNLNKNFNYLQISDIDLNNGLTYSTIEVDFADIPDRATYILQKNDICVSTVRPNRNAVALIKKPKRLIGTSGFCVLRLKEKNILPEFLYIFCKTYFFITKMMRANTASLYPAVLDSDIYKCKIPLLPMSFQLEIEKLVKDSHLALEQSKALYKEAEDLLYTELGLNPQNPLQSILQSHSNNINFRIATLKESFLKTGRLDSEYYQVKYDLMEDKLKSKGFKILEEICSLINYGSVPTSPYSENDEGVPYIKGLNLKNLIVDETKLDKITNTQDLDSKFFTKENDIIISQMGTVGDVGIVRKEQENYIFASFTIRIRLKDTKEFNPYFVGMYIQHIAKEWYLYRHIAQASVRQNTDLPTIKNLYVPLVDIKIQTQIASHIQKSFALRAEAKALLNEAKAKVESAISGGGGGVNSASFVALRIQIFRIYFPQIKAKLRDSKRYYRLGEWELLENLLGLETLSFSKNSFDKNIKSFKFSKNSHTQKLNISIQSLSQSFGVSGRLDSEYYQSKYERNEAMIKSKPYVRLRDIVAIQKSIEPGSEAYRESGIPFIRVSNLSAFGISQSEVYLDSKDFNEKQLESLYPKKGTILFSKDGSVGISYCVENDLECVTSGAILHLTIKNKALILPQYLSLVLNAITTKLQAQRDSGGSIIAHWKISEIENLLIPLLELSIQETIESKIAQSFALRAKSKELLEEAKAKVEAKISLSLRSN